MNNNILKSNINLYEENIVSLVKYWINNESISEILKKHEIISESFVRDYVLEIIEYSILLLKEEERIGAYPEIDKFLLYLKEKEISTSELFILCSGFKNSFIELSYESKIINFEIQKKINDIFEKNFVKVLEKYSKSIFVLQKEIENQQAILVEQYKSAAMGEMIAMIAHQWRQPLQAVSILTQKLPITKMLEGKIEDELLDQVVTDIRKQLIYMSKTIDDFRDFFLPNKAKELVSLKALLKKSFKFILFFIKTDSINININAKKDFTILIYENELIQVLINILKNSRDAMLENKIEKKEININFYQENNSTFIDIEDNAGGIATNIIDKIFEPYFSTKSNKNGTGLGLYMCKTIIEKHCLGKISVSNSKNGALFKIELPKE